MIFGNWKLFKVAVGKAIVPAPPAKPIVVAAVLGWIVKVLVPVPVMAPPILIASVVRVRFWLAPTDVVLLVVILVPVKVKLLPKVTAPV